MRKAHLILLIGVAALSVWIFGLNLRLNKLNRQLKGQLEGLIRTEKAANSPAPGWAMPILKINRADGSPYPAPGLDLQHSAHKMAILLFETTNCPVCDQNWAFWNKLLADPDISPQFVPLTSAHTISAEYLQRFHLEQQPVQAGLDPDLAKQMHMLAKPQTILVEDGIVRKVWFGLLSDVDVKEIALAMQMED